MWIRVVNCWVLGARGIGSLLSTRMIVVADLPYAQPCNKTIIYVDMHCFEYQRIELEQKSNDKNHYHRFIGASLV